MTILPPSSVTRLGDPLTAAMSHLDGCPQCVHNTEMPTAAVPDGTDAWLCHYACTDCGHTWTTAWGSF